MSINNAKIAVRFSDETDVDHVHDVGCGQMGEEAGQLLQSVTLIRGGGRWQRLDRKRDVRRKTNYGRWENMEPIKKINIESSQTSSMIFVEHLFEVTQLHSITLKKNTYQERSLCPCFEAVFVAHPSI